MKYPSSWRNGSRLRSAAAALNSVTAAARNRGALPGGAISQSAANGRAVTSPAKMPANAVQTRCRRGQNRTTSSARQ